MITRLFAVMLFALAVVAAQPAHAATLTITDLYCEGIGSGRYFCTSTVSGGAGGNTYTWTRKQIGSIATATFTTSGSNTGVRGCSSGYSYDITLTVRDSAGATASANSSFYCYRIAP